MFVKALVESGFKPNELERGRAQANATKRSWLTIAVVVALLVSLVLVSLTPSSQKIGSRVSASQYLTDHEAPVGVSKHACVGRVTKRAMSIKVCVLCFFFLDTLTYKLN